ncbi:MAG: hypothetical protein AABY22_03625, partial [Nanoarchaeota archaeon]
MIYQNPFKLEDCVICNEDTPGELSKQSTLSKNKTYIVIAIYKNSVMVNDGTIGFWLASRFKKYIQTWSEKILDD